MFATRPSTREIGAKAEALACRHLLDRGLGLRARNYRCPHGEIDLVMNDGQTIVFVEVRLRSRWDYGGAAESVDSKKRMRILASAEHYLQRHATLMARCRFDVVAIDRSGNSHRLRWLRDAFGA